LHQRASKVVLQFGGKSFQHLELARSPDWCKSRIALQKCKSRDFENAENAIGSRIADLFGAWRPQDFCTNLPSFRAKLGRCFAITFGGETSWSFEHMAVQKSKVGVRILELIERVDKEVERSHGLQWHLLYILSHIYICINCAPILHSATVFFGGKGKDFAAKTGVA
jgi:hypothetical protein